MRSCKNCLNSLNFPTKILIRVCGQSFLKSTRFGLSLAHYPAFCTLLTWTLTRNLPGFFILCFWNYREQEKRIFVFSIFFHLLHIEIIAEPLNMSHVAHRLPDLSEMRLGLLLACLQGVQCMAGQIHIAFLKASFKGLDKV